MVKLLAGEGGGLCAVGDPDQSIYGWRGACIGNILEFEKSFPGTRTVRLEQNYRSTKPILSAAGRLIANNSQRIERGLEAVRSGGSPVQLFLAVDEQHEASEVASRIAKAVARGRRYADVAVFYRTNAQSRPFEEAFLQQGVPYALVNGTAFYQRAEIKDALAYLRLAVNPRDSVSFARVINQPPRGLGEGSLRRMDEAVRSRGVSPMEAAACGEVRSTLSARALQGLESFTAAVASVGGATAYPVEQAVRRMLADSGLLQRYRTQDEEERVENLDQLAAAAGEYDFANPEGSLAAFLEQVALVADIDGWDEKADRVSLMTLHAAKGLEFPLVCLTGLEEGVLPHSRSGKMDDIDIEEERRLAYVGMTRARDELILTLARARRRFGPLRPSAASRFIAELPAGEIAPAGMVAKAVACSELRGEGDDWNGDTGFRSRSRAQFAPRTRPGPAAEASHASGKGGTDDGRYFDEAALARASAEALDLDAGDLVVHPKFGRGRVEAVEGFGEAARITVNFSGYGRKKLVAAYSKLQKA
jgi:DNA helicase-2/ATP-dependent DNA helicase PcrA